MRTSLDIVSPHVLFRVRNAYPAFDLKTNTGKIWSIATSFPEHILGGTKFRISVWTDFSPHPLLLTQHGKIIYRSGEACKSSNERRDSS